METMGIIFSNIYDNFMDALTEKRTSASIPVGGRYRQIDFILSNMANSGVRHIGIITKYNYQSLMDHLGSCQEWDLQLNTNGVVFLPPYATGHTGIYRGKLEALQTALPVLVEQQGMPCWQSSRYDRHCHSDRHWYHLFYRRLHSSRMHNTS